MALTQGMMGPGRAIVRDEAILRAPAGWRALIHRAYNRIEQVPRLRVGRVDQCYGRLIIECSTRPVPGHVLWRLAAIERLSIHVCQVCGLRGRLIPVAQPIHWLVDDPHVFCGYHHWRELRGETIEQMLDERLLVLSRGPDIVQEILLGDVSRIAPARFREALAWLGDTDPAGDGSGFVFEHRVAWALEHASVDQLRACLPTDLSPFFSWADPDVREAALRALALLRPWPAFVRSVISRKAKPHRL